MIAVQRAKLMKTLSALAQDPQPSTPFEVEEPEESVAATPQPAFKKDHSYFVGFDSEAEMAEGVVHIQRNDGE